MRKFQVVTYYTKYTGYEREVERLKESMDAFGVAHHIEAIDSLGNWYANTHYKSTFLLQMLELSTSENIVFVDADAEFMAYPTLFETLECDLGAHFRNWQMRKRQVKNELLSGTLFLANNARVVKLLKSWITENHRNPITWDQKNLQNVLQRHPDINVHELPIEYCAIFDDTNVRGGKVRPVIMHYQKSREYRQAVR